MPNPHDVGSACLLQSLGFSALATTSSGYAASLGRMDMDVTRDELVAHVFQLTSALNVPLNVDAEQCFPNSSGGIVETITQLAQAGASGISLEDWNPDSGDYESLELSVERIQLAAIACDGYGITLTARAENHIRGRNNLDDTIARLTAFCAAGAHAVYAPGLATLGDITQVATQVPSPLNVLLLPGGPTVDQLASVGVRRISVGSLLSYISYGALVFAATSLRDEGHLPMEATYLAGPVAHAAFRPRAAT